MHIYIYIYEESLVRSFKFLFSLLFQPAESMNDQTTPVPSVQTSAPFVPRFPDLVTRIGQKGLYILTMVLRAVFTVSLWYKGGGGGSLLWTLYLGWLFVSIVVVEKKSSQFYWSPKTNYRELCTFGLKYGLNQKS